MFLPSLHQLFNFKGPPTKLPPVCAIQPRTTCAFCTCAAVATEFQSSLPPLCRFHIHRLPCKIDACEKIAVKDGVCLFHGDPSICHMDGCHEPSRKPYGRCKDHTPPKQCIVPQCLSSARSKQRCYAHGGGRRCLYVDPISSERCSNGAVSKDLCKKHGGGRRCNKEGCDNSAESRGRCYKHGGGKRKKSEIEGKALDLSAKPSKQILSSVVTEALQEKSIAHASVPPKRSLRIMDVLN